MTKPKPDTKWYDSLCSLYQQTKIPELRNILWEQVKLLIYQRIRKFVNEKKGIELKKNTDLLQRLNQEAFFIFTKATEVWDPARKTKFLTFLGDILDQEIMNIIRMDWYYKTRDFKICRKLMYESSVEQIPIEQEQFEKKEFLEEIKNLLANYGFESELERDIIYTVIYGVAGDWAKLQKKSKLSVAGFSKVRKKITEKMKKYILDNCSEKQKAVLKEILGEK